MADKFIYHGAAFNGDGTTSSVAASNGAAGAWNDIAYMEGTTPAYGSIGAGDVVTVRARDAAGALIERVRSTAVTLGSTAATEASPIEWVIDNGTVWSGITGVLTYRWTANVTGATIAAHNIIRADAVDGLKFVPNGTMNSAILVLNAGTIGVNFYLDCASGGGAAYVSAQAGFTRLRRCHYRGGTWFGRIFGATNYASLTLEDPQIELTAVDADPVLLNTGAGSRIHVLGGKTYGAGAISGITMATSNVTAGGEVVLIGHDYPYAVKLADPPVTVNCLGIVRAFSADSLFAAEAVYVSGQFSSRDDGNFPTLNATLPDSLSTTWSYKVAASAKAFLSSPLVIDIVKMYSDVDAVKTITLELMRATGVSGASKRNVWMDVYYIDDATGLRVLETTQVLSGGALDSSTAGWSATTYGALSFVKHKLTLTTAGSIRQNTPVQVSLRIALAGTDPTTEVWFVCPDVQVS